MNWNNLTKEEEFNKKFEGYWRGQAISEEIKFFYRSHLKELLREVSRKPEDFDGRKWQDWQRFGEQVDKRIEEIIK